LDSGAFLNVSTRAVTLDGRSMGFALHNDCFAEWSQAECCRFMKQGIHGILGMFREKAVDNRDLGPGKTSSGLIMLGWSARTNGR
jgi:hypothetical protein